MRDLIIIAYQRPEQCINFGHYMSSPIAKESAPPWRQESIVQTSDISKCTMTCSGAGCLWQYRLHFKLVPTAL